MPEPVDEPQHPSTNLPSGKTGGDERGSLPAAATPMSEEQAAFAVSSDDGSNSSLGDTVGTGTVVALGCIGGTVFLIVLGLVYLLITQIFG